MTAIVSVYAVFTSEEEALRVSRDMVERRFAACANILGPCRSVFRWQGKLCEENEVAAVFKTPSARAGALVEAIAEAHSYDVPAICAWPVERTLTDYAQWVAEETGGGK